MSHTVSDSNYLLLITRLLDMNANDLQEMRKPFNRDLFPKAVAIWEYREQLLASLYTSYLHGGDEVTQDEEVR